MGQQMATGQFDLIIATQDWHPANHGSFASQYDNQQTGDVIELAGLQQVLWPDHCVQNTGGALFAASLNTHLINGVFPKGTDPNMDSYSGFFDNGHRQATGMRDYLKAMHVDEVAIMGLATDYCVKFTALDAIKLGFKTILIQQGCRGVELNPGDCDNAIEEMKQAGVVIQN